MLTLFSRIIVTHDSVSVATQSCPNIAIDLNVLTGTQPFTHSSHIRCVGVAIITDYHLVTATLHLSMETKSLRHDSHNRRAIKCLMTEIGNFKATLCFPLVTAWVIAVIRTCVSRYLGQELRAGVNISHYLLCLNSSTLISSLAFQTQLIDGTHVGTSEGKTPNLAL